LLRSTRLERHKRQGRQKGTTRGLGKRSRESEQLKLRKEKADHHEMDHEVKKGKESVGEEGWTSSSQALRVDLRRKERKKEYGRVKPDDNSRLILLKKNASRAGYKKGRTLVR